MGPGPRFELGRKAPQASMLPSYTTPAAFPWNFRNFGRFMLGFDTLITNTLFSFAEDFSAIVIVSGQVLKARAQKT